MVVLTIIFDKTFLAMRVLGLALIMTSPSDTQSLHPLSCPLADILYVSEILYYTEKGVTMRVSLDTRDGKR